MKIKRPTIIIGSLTLMAMAVTTVGMLFLSHTNDLGLTGFDIIIGGRPNMNTLRANTRAVADSFLAQHKGELADHPERVTQLAVDYSKCSKVRAHGYRSSFYYYCWDIYLPYSLRTQAGQTRTVLVHLSDSVGHDHDPQKFRVLDVRLLDEQGSTTKTIRRI